MSELSLLEAQRRILGAPIPTEFATTSGLKMTLEISESLQRFAGAVVTASHRTVTRQTPLVSNCTKRTKV